MPLDKSTGRPSLAKSDLLKIEMPVPSIDEQRRIVYRIEELFCELDNSVSTLQKTKEQLAVYRQASITSAYPVMTKENTKKLSEISDITGGITKGRDLKQAETIFLPYLRVANVQNGFLDLTEIKEIELKADEKEKYLLKKGDVLYTEGGDRDKLGRGTVWNEEIPDCVHQNHVFRARVDKSIAIPEYVAYWSMGSYARTYFFRKGKQTVNLASINKTVLSNLELPIPDLVTQEKVLAEIESGKADVTVGTHAIIQKDVRFSDLALVITDEQHRFGVNQRKTLVQKGRGVNVLVMSATPIPRTLAATVFGDMDFSIIRSRPEGRREIITRALDKSSRQRAYRPGVNEPRRYWLRYITPDMRYSAVAIFRPKGLRAAMLRLKVIRTETAKGNTVDIKSVSSLYGARHHQIFINFSLYFFYGTRHHKVRRA